MNKVVTKPRRQSFSLIDYLQQTNQEKEHPEQKSKTQTRLEDVVNIIQSELKQMENETSENTELLHRAGIGEPHAQEKVRAVIRQIINDRRIYASTGQLQDQMSLPDAVFVLTVGAGYIDDLYKRKDIEEVQVNGKNIFIMREGVTIPYPREFDSLKQVMALQERLALFGRSKISERHPICHTYMHSGSRLVMTQPPYTAFPTITIRNFLIADPTLKDLISRGTLNQTMGDLLSLLVKYHCSIVVAGGTKTGKTTTLQALAAEIPKQDRIVTLENHFEMMLDKRFPERNIVPFQSISHLGLTMEAAFRDILLESPDRIIVGEVRGPETSQAIQATLRGHDGMVTLHSKFRNMILQDMMDMVKQDGRKHEDDSLKHRIARAFNIIVFQRFYRENEYRNRRIMTEITEVVPYEDGTIEMRPLFVFDYKGNTWKPTGNNISRELFEHMIAYGASVDEISRLGVEIDDHSSS